MTLDNTDEPYLGGIRFTAMPPMKRFRFILFFALCLFLFICVRRLVDFLKIVQWFQISYLLILVQQSHAVVCCIMHSQRHGSVVWRRENHGRSGSAFQCALVPPGKFACFFFVVFFRARELFFVFQEHANNFRVLSFYSIYGN